MKEGEREGMLYTGTGCVSVLLGVYAVCAPPDVNRTHAHLVGSMHPSSQSQHTKKSSSRFIFTSTKESEGECEVLLWVEWVGVLY